MSFEHQARRRGRGASLHVRGGEGDHAAHDHYAASVRDALVVDPSRIDSVINKARNRMVEQSVWPGGPALIARLLRLRRLLPKERGIVGKRNLVRVTLSA